MPKAKWGEGENMLTAEDINGAEVLETFQRYSGPVPSAGTYRWTIETMKKDVSGAGNNKVVIRMSLDGDWKPNHGVYNGAPVWHHLALTKANAANVRNFLDSIGATSADLLNGAIVDEGGYVTKLGQIGDPTGIQVYATVKRSEKTAKYPDDRIEVAYGGYIMIDDGNATAADAAGDEAEAPF